VLLPLIALACRPAHAEITDVPMALEFRDELPRNVLMISIDTLRKDYVGRYNPGLDTRGDDAIEQTIEQSSRRLVYRWDGTLEYYDLRELGEWEDHYDPDDEYMLRLWQFLEPRVAALDAQVPEATPTLPRL
jgi:hypothetical protein